MVNYMKSLFESFEQTFFLIVSVNHVFIKTIHIDTLSDRWC